MPNVKSIQDIWSKFYSIYKIIRINEAASPSTVRVLRHSTLQWITLFTSVYQTKNLIPYIHVLITHILEFYTYGNIAVFNQQGLEKLNDEVTQHYFQSTNHRNIESLKQLLLKLNRLEEMAYNDCCRKIHVQACKICKQPGHNTRTCEHKHI